MAPLVAGRRHVRRDPRGRATLCPGTSYNGTRAHVPRTPCPPFPRQSYSCTVKLRRLAAWFRGLRQCPTRLFIGGNHDKATRAMHLPRYHTPAADCKHAPRGADIAHHAHPDCTHAPRRTRHRHHVLLWRAGTNSKLAGVTTTPRSATVQVLQSIGPAAVRALFAEGEADGDVAVRAAAATALPPPHPSPDDFVAAVCAQPNAFAFCGG